MQYLLNSYTNLYVIPQKLFIWLYYFLQHSVTTVYVIKITI